MDPELVRKIQELGQRIDALTLPEVGAQPVFLTTPLTNASFNGDSFSDVAANTKIENTSWSSTIPSNAKALLIRITARDSGSAGTNNLYVGLYGAAAATNDSLRLYLNGIPNDAYGTCSGVVPCTDGDIWYRCNASGASTLDIWLECYGYWL